MAPRIHGPSQGPAQGGSQPGLASAPAPGCLVAHRVPPGHPSDSASVVPCLAQGQRAMARRAPGPKRQSHAGAGDLGRDDAVVRQGLPPRGILTVGLPTTGEPSKTKPSAPDIEGILQEAG